jgi:hypothetical protein
VKRLEFKLILPDGRSQPWEERERPGPPSSRLRWARKILLLTALVLAAADGVDSYRANVAELARQNRSAADANVTIRLREIEDARLGAEAVRMVRERGSGVYGIEFKQTGPNTVAQVQPAVAGVVLSITIDGTDRYHNVQRLITDQNGEIAFQIPPPGVRPVWDQIAITTAEQDGRAIRSASGFYW